MDDGIKIDKLVSPWDIEPINDNDYVYRQILAPQRIGTKPKKYPSESHFSLREGEESLSFNWDKYIDVPKNYKLISITQNNGKLLEYTSFKIFRYEVNFLRSLPKFKHLSHFPTFNGCPSPIGSPNNKSHVSLSYDNNFDEGIRVSLSDYCIDNFEKCHCALDLKLFKEEVEELRKKDNNTPYHKLWDFPEDSAE